MVDRWRRCTRSLGGKMDRPNMGITIDFGPILEFESAFEELKRAWRKVPAAARPALSRMILMYPDGGTMVYRTPDSERTERETS